MIRYMSFFLFPLYHRPRRHLMRTQRPLRTLPTSEYTLFKCARSAMAEHGPRFTSAPHRGVGENAKPDNSSVLIHNCRELARSAFRFRR